MRLFKIGEKQIAGFDDAVGTIESHRQIDRRNFCGHHIAAEQVDFFRLFAGGFYFVVDAGRYWLLPVFTAVIALYVLVQAVL